MHSCSYLSKQGADLSASTKRDKVHETENVEDHFAREGQKVLFLGVNNVEVTITALVDVHSRRRKRSESEEWHTEWLYYFDQRSDELT